MQKVGILPNISRDLNLKYTKTLTKWLQQKNYCVFVSDNCGDVPFATVEPIEVICKKCNFVIVLGGDGTILEKVVTCAKYGTPLIGINLGSIGYLTDVEMPDGIQAIEKVLNNNYKTEQRILIETYINNNVYTALNDICITKVSNAKLITLDVHINTEYIDTYRADGIIVSTPTGSTAYNLSAGGPIIKPNVDAMVITPISPYKLYSRPLVISGKDTVTISSPDNLLLQVLVDGNEINSKHEVTIKQSSNYAKIIRTTQLNFYDILRKKFSI